MKRWLVETERGSGRSTTEDVRLHEHEKDVMQVVADVAADTAYDGKKLKKIYLVDLDNGTMERYEPVLVNFKLKLQVKEIPALVGHTTGLNL